MQLLLIVGLVIATTGTYEGEDGLRAAKELYASAAYEDALSALERIDRSDSTAREVDEYRAFCLYALGRHDEAERVAEALVRTDPLAPLNEGETSPRIAVMFRAVQKRLVPVLIRDEFRLAKSAHAAQNAAEAEEHFTRARRLLTEAEKLDVIDEALVDLRTLVDGFLELSHARTNRAAPPTVEAPGTSAVAQTASVAATAGGEAPSIDVPQRRENAAPKVYTSGDAGVTPPVAVRQVMPAVPVDLVRILKTGSGRRGALDIVVDERGSVQDAVMREPMNAMYDDILVTAARRWKFQPAIKDGVPVPFRKTIVIDSRP